LDAKGCARCCVVTNAIYDKSTQQWTDVPQSWKMFYEGVSPLDDKHRIFEAESNDLFTWTKRGLALDVGEDGAWDAKGVSSPHCIRYVKLTERTVSCFASAKFAECSRADWMMGRNECTTPVKGPTEALLLASPS
jgi:hypothetical protein